MKLLIFKALITILSVISTLILALLIKYPEVINNSLVVIPLAVIWITTLIINVGMYNR